MTKLTTLLLMTAVALCAAATDVTGRWTGTATMHGPQGQTKDSSALLELKQEGTQVTGTVGPEGGDRHTITKGSIDGDKVILEVQGDAGPVLKFELKAEGDTLKGEAHGSSPEGQTMKMELNLKRVK